MKDCEQLSLRSPRILFLSVFGIGFFSKFPGTLGTLIVLPILYNLNISSIVLWPIFIVLTLLSCYIAESVQKDYNLHDPSWIVVDEVLGISLAVTFLKTMTISHLLLIAVLFRIFDIFKVWPATYFDRSVQHGCGTILDDLVSALYAGIAYRSILLLF